MTELEFWTSYRDKLREGILKIASGVASYSIQSGNTTQNITRQNISEFEKRLVYAESQVKRLDGTARRMRMGTIL